MFYPEDEKEARDVMAYWQRTQNFEAVYVGISDRIVEGLFDTIDGEYFKLIYLAVFIMKYKYRCIIYIIYFKKSVIA